METGEKMKCGHLFNGISGFGLAASWMGWENVFHSEIDHFCNQVMKRHFPNSIEHGDIKEQDFSTYRGAIDLLTGGFPCPSFSTAGKHLGTEDPRYLWPDMFRAVREIQPGYVVAENVRGLTNWKGGVVFDQVQTDLETEGYEVLPFLLPAAGVSAPHERYRIWFVAHAGGRRISLDETGIVSDRNGHRSGEIREESIFQSWASTYGKIRTTADAQGQRRGKAGQDIGRPEKRDSRDGRERTAPYPLQFNGGEIQIEDREPGVGQESIGCGTERGNAGWDRWPTQHPLSRGDDGVSAKLAGLTTSQYRRACVASFGNAIVPQVALQIFKAIESYENQLSLARESD